MRSLAASARRVRPLSHAAPPPSPRRLVEPSALRRRERACSCTPTGSTSATARCCRSGPARCTTGGTRAASGGRVSRRCARWALRLVDTYVPWGVHETAPGEYDFGEGDSRLDVAGFLASGPRGRPEVRDAPGATHQRGDDALRPARARRLGPRLPGPHAGRSPGHAADGARRVPRAELRERRVPRGDGALVPRRRQAALGAALARGAHRPRPGRQRGRALLPRRRLRSGLPPRRAPRVPRLPARKVPAPARAARRVERRRRRRSRPSSRRVGSTRRRRRTSRGTWTGPSSTSSSSRWRWSAWPPR